MKIIALPGLGADHRLFHELIKCNLDVEPVDFIPQIPGESLRKYACRLIDQVNPPEEYVLMGVSFGAILGTEIMNYRPARQFIGVSAYSGAQFLGKALRIARKVGLQQILPEQVLKFMSSRAAFIFDVSSKNKSLFRQMIWDLPKGQFKWSINSISQWRKHYDVGMITVVGTKDKVFPYNKEVSHYTVSGGGHYMIIENAEEIVNIVNRILVKHSEIEG